MSKLINVQKKGILCSLNKVFDKQIYENIINTGELSKVNNKIEKYLKRFNNINDFNSLRTANVDCNYFITKSIYYGNFLSSWNLKNHEYNTLLSLNTFKKEVLNSQKITIKINNNNDKINENINEKISYYYNNQIKIIKLMIFLYYNFNLRMQYIEFSIPIIFDYKVLHVYNRDSNILLFSNIMEYHRNVISFSYNNDCNNKLELILNKYQCGL